MSLAKISLKTKHTNNENDLPKHLPLSSTQKENKLTQLIQSHNTIRQSGLSSSRTILKPRKPLGQKSLNTTKAITNAILKENIKPKEISTCEKKTHTHKENITIMKSCIIHKSSQEKLKEPSISYALPVSKSTSTDSDIFAHIDTPVHILPAECLITIFKYCEGFENYCTLLSVCRRWRSIAGQPSIWENTHFKWSVFSKLIDILHQPRKRFQQLDYIKKLTIEKKSKTTIIDPLNNLIRITPFRMIEELHLIDMDLKDISFLISWLKNIKILHCKNIHTSRGKINFSIFSELNQLESLHLHFSEPSPTGQTFFRLGSLAENTHKKMLPESLKSLSIWNVYDCERNYYSAHLSNYLHGEDLLNQPLRIQESHQRCWSYIDEILVLKYRMFVPLNNLKSLRLGQIDSFSSRVWRECMIPCAKNLEYLAMDMWQESSRRESPHRLLVRYRQQLQSPGDDLPLFDVEVALSEFIASLKNIKQINLNRFYCSDGIINGLAKLRRPYTISCDDGLEIKDLNEFKHITLPKVCIEFSDT